MIGLHIAILCCVFAVLEAIKCRSGGTNSSRSQYDRWLFSYYGSKCNNLDVAGYLKLTQPHETVCEIPKDLVENNCDSFIVASCYTASIVDEKIGSTEFIWGCGITHYDLVV